MKVRFLQLHTVQASELAVWESWLSPEKRQRLVRMTEKKRLQSLCGDALARQMLSETLGIAPEKIEFTYTEKGKPLTDSVCFSVSHSGDLVGCALSARPVGLDVERIRIAPQRLCRAAGAESNEAFFRFWTKREAWLKCRGETVASRQAWGLPEENYCFFEPEVPEGYCACVCEEK